MGNSRVNKAGQTHDQLQAACWKWACRQYHPYVYRRLIAIPNDMHAGNVARWKQYEALGVTPGVWDMQFNWIEQIETPDGGYTTRIGRIIPATYWWEFKVGSDTLSPKQIKFQEQMKPFGHTFNVCSEEDQFQFQFKLIVEPTIDYIKRIHKAE